METKMLIGVLFALISTHLFSKIVFKNRTIKQNYLNMKYISEEHRVKSELHFE